MNGLLHMVVSNGGFTVVVIAAVSVLALTAAVERAWRLLPLRARFLATHATVTDRLLRGGLEEAARAAGSKEAGDAMGRVLKAGLEARRRGPEVVRVVALDAAQREVAALERGLGMLLVAAQVAPLLGLLGTVIGLIEAFKAASEAAAVTPALLSAGLSKALGTTVAGLWVAIPAYIAYGTLSSLAGRLIDQLEHAATDLPTILHVLPSAPAAKP